MDHRTLPDRGRYLGGTTPTPLVALKLEDDDPAVYCKLEFLNPSGSTKDRIARHMLETAWRRGDVGPGDLVVEASSGSTSIALALACAQLGLDFTAVMPEGVSRERLLMISAFGAKFELTPKAEGMAGALGRAEELSASGRAFYTRQFENPDNVEAHRLGTGREIVTQVPGGYVDAVVSGVGTGGTITGLHHACRDAGCEAAAFAARPISGSGLHAECSSFSQRVPGVIDGMSKLYVPAEFTNLTELDVDDELALTTTRRLIQRGFPVGPSSGLNFCAALDAARSLPAGATVVTVFPDRMERYFSTELFRG